MNLSHLTCPALKPSHIGEYLITEILKSLANRGDLSLVTCARTKEKLVDDIQVEQLGNSFDFFPEAAQLIVKNHKGEFTCDGEQKVDVLCAGTGRAIAFESKLGEKRMTPSGFRKRFCKPCIVSTKHRNSRLNGSMVAVLERNFDAKLSFGETAELVAHVGKEKWTLARNWWLVIRKSIAEKWLKPSKHPVESARILIFDDLVRLYGNAKKFDQLVLGIVGSDFANRWKISF